MPREDAQTKGRRYLTEGRLTIVRVGQDFVIAEARGDGARYQLGFTPERLWHCDCPARTDQCAHLVALRLVTVR